MLLLAFCKKKVMAYIMDWDENLLNVKNYIWGSP